MCIPPWTNMSQGDAEGGPVLRRSSRIPVRKRRWGEPDVRDAAGLPPNHALRGGEREVVVEPEEEEVLIQGRARASDLWTQPEVQAAIVEE